MMTINDFMEHNIKIKAKLVKLITKYNKSRSKTNRKRIYEQIIELEKKLK